MSGSAQAIFAKEQSFLGSPVDSDSDGSPEYYDPGKGTRTQDVELTNALQRIREGDSAEAVESIATRLEGALAVQFTMNSTEWLDLVTNDGSGSSLVPGQMPSSRWFVGVDYINGTAERELKGVIPLDYRIQYQEGETVTVSLTMAYADETYNTSLTPSNVQEGGDPFVFHGTSLTVDGVTQTKMQSATLSMQNIARLQRGAQRKAVDAVVAAPTAALDAETIVSETDQLQLAYGNANAPATSGVSSVSGSFEISNGTTTTTWSLSQVKPDTYNWTDVLNREADFTEPITYHVNGVSVA